MKEELKRLFQKFLDETLPKGGVNPGDFWRYASYQNFIKWLTNTVGMTPCKRCRTSIAGITVLNEDGLCFPCENELTKRAYDTVQECQNCKDHPDGDYGECGDCHRMIAVNPTPDKVVQDTKDSLHSEDRSKLKDDLVYDTKGWEERIMNNFGGLPIGNTYIKTTAELLLEIIAQERILAQREVIEDLIKMAGIPREITGKRLEAYAKSKGI